MRHAPPGGIAQHGQWYEGGQFLPDEEMFGRTRAERVRKGDIRSFRCGDTVRYTDACGEHTGGITWINWRDGLAEITGARRCPDMVPLRELEFVE